jgi:hypothetical protein
MPLNACEAAGVGAAAPDDVAAGADAAGADAAVVGAELAPAEPLGVVDAPHAVTTRIKPTADAMRRNRDTGFLLLTTPQPSSILNDRQ